jgi:hypothetical protein
MMKKEGKNKLMRSQNPQYFSSLFQLIVSRVILESGLCTLPENNKLWDAVRVTPNQNEVDDQVIVILLLIVIRS